MIVWVLGITEAGYSNSTRMCVLGRGGRCKEGGCKGGRGERGSGGREGGGVKEGV